MANHFVRYRPNKKLRYLSFSSISVAMLLSPQLSGCGESNTRGLYRSDSPDDLTLGSLSEAVVVLDNLSRLPPCAKSNRNVVYYITGRHPTFKYCNWPFDYTAIDLGDLGLSLLSKTDVAPACPSYAPLCCDDARQLQVLWVGGAGAPIETRSSLAREALTAKQECNTELASTRAACPVKKSANRSRLAMRV